MISRKCYRCRYGTSLRRSLCYNFLPTSNRYYSRTLPQRYPRQPDARLPLMSTATWCPLQAERYGTLRDIEGHHDCFSTPVLWIPVSRLNYIRLDPEIAPYSRHECIVVQWSLWLNFQGRGSIHQPIGRQEMGRGRAVAKSIGCPRPPASWSEERKFKEGLGGKDSCIFLSLFMM